MPVRSYASAVTMRLGIATTVGRLAPIRVSRSKKTEFKLCTPTAKPVRQVYIDDDGNIFEKDQLGRAIEQDGVLVPVPLDKVNDAKVSELPLNIMELTVHRRDEIDRFLFPSDNNAYIFEPVRKTPKGKVINDPVNTQWYEFINVVLRDNPGVALLGKMNLQGFEGLFRLGLYQGLITVQKQLYPEELNQFEFATPELDEETRRLAVAASETLLAEFEPGDYQNNIQARLEAIQAGDIGIIGEATTVATEEPQSSLKDALRMMVKS